LYLELANNKKTWLGLNLLGKAVTGAREIIKAETK